MLWDNIEFSEHEVSVIRQSIGWMFEPETKDAQWYTDERTETQHVMPWKTKPEL